MDAERTKLSQEQRMLQAQYSEMQEQLSGKLAQAEKEVRASYSGGKAAEIARLKMLWIFQVWGFLL